VRIGRGFDETNGRTAERRLALHSAERLSRRARGCAADVAVALIMRREQHDNIEDRDSTLTKAGIYVEGLFRTIM
jgi:hypothetical protein